MERKVEFLLYAKLLYIFRWCKAKHAALASTCDDL